MHEHFKKELLISVTIIIGGIIVMGLVLYLFSRDLSSQAEKIVASRTLIIRSSQAIDALADLKKSAVRVQTYKQAMDKLLVPHDQLLDFRGWLDGLSRARQINVNFDFEGGQVQPQGEAPGSVGFAMDLNGPLDNLIDFIKDVEIRAPRFLVSLSSFDLSKADTSYNIRSRGTIYFK